MSEINKSNFTVELSEVYSYMTDKLLIEFPTDTLSPEYLILSILDNKNCHANLILDNCLMSNNIDELRDIFSSVMREHIKPQFKDDALIGDELERLILCSSNESKKMNNELVGTEHVLLALLNRNNKFIAGGVFAKFRLEYDFVFNKCNASDERRQQNLLIPKKRNHVRNNQQPNSIPLKSQINQSSVISSDKGVYVPKYTININEMARNGEIDEIIGRENEINEIIKVLSKRKKNNAILVGGGGTGKTAIVHGIANLIEKHKVPEVLENKEIVMLNIMELVSGTHFRGMFEERINGLLTELQNSKKYILFIDDIHTVLKSGSKEKDTDISGVIGDALSEGKIKIIATTTYKEYRNTIETNSSLSRKFQKILIEPNTVDESIEILMKNKKYYEEYHNVTYDENVIKHTVGLANRYITDRCLPDSAFDVIDIAGASTVLKNREPIEVVNTKKRLKELESEKLNALNNGDFERIDSLSVEENVLLSDIADYKRDKDRPEKERVAITESDIEKTVSEITKVPINKLSLNEKAKIAHIDDTLKKSIIGQDEAIESICRVIKRNRVGLGDKNKTGGTFLLGGSTGVGKTLLAKKIAEEIYGSEKALIRIDMSEYSEKNSVSKLHGCFTPEMNVLMSDGSYKKISDVEIGDYVITHTGNIKKVLNKFEYLIEENIKNINVSSTNFNIRCTNGHNILSIAPKFKNNGRFDNNSYDSSNASFMRADALVKDSILLYPKNINHNEKKAFFDLVNFLGKTKFYRYDEKYVYSIASKKRINRIIPLNENLARILGYYVSEGGVSKSYKAISFTFNIEECEYIDEIKKLMNNVFGFTTCKIRERKERHSSTITFYSRIIAYFISSLCGRECHSKKIPNELFNTSKKIKINFLETALYGDGTKCMVKQTKYTSVSLTLASQINSLFRSIGYSTQFVKEEHTENKFNTTYRVILTGSSIDKLNNEFPNLRIKSYEIKPNGIHRKHWIDDTNYYYRINSIENEYYSGLVYDLTIEDDSSYIVNGFSVHNSSPGYVGYDDGGVLTNSIKQKPYSVVLLDEIEKADESIYNLFLQIFDEGRITESNGNLVNCKNCIFIMTSNIGAKKASELGNGLGFVTNESTNKKSIIEKELKKKFTPEFLNRLDDIVYFNNLTDDNLKDIVILEINKFITRLNSINYNIKYNDDVITYIHERALDKKEFGARPIIRLIQTNIEDKITDLILTNDYPPNYTFSASCSNNNIVIS